jgi:hypothetical protein
MSEEVVVLGVLASVVCWTYIVLPLMHQFS